MQKIIIVDMDGTLANCDHRRHFVEGEKKDWKSFLSPENVMKDTVNEWCNSIIERFSKNSINSIESGTIDLWINDDCIPIFVTGRPEYLRETTYIWLKQVDLERPASHYTLFMRPDGNKDPDYIIKQRIYDEHIKDKYEVLFVLDDRKSVVDMWRRNGLVCLQCAEGEF